MQLPVHQLVAQYLRTIAKAIPRLNRIPPQTGPVRGRLLSLRFVWHWTRIERHLHLTAPVMIIDQIKITASWAYVRNRPPQSHVHPSPHHPIIQPDKVVRRFGYPSVSLCLHLAYDGNSEK